MNIEPGSRVLLVAPNWLGDAIMAVPAVAAVRRSLPHVQVEIAARPSIVPLFALVPDAGSVVTLNRKDDRATIRDGRYDTAILFPNSFNAAWIVHRAGVRQRWGYATAGRSVLLTRAVPALTGLHQIDYYRQLVRALGFDANERVPALTATAEGRAAGDALLTAQGWTSGEPLVAVAPGAAFGTAKRWPAASFAEVIDGLAGDGLRAVLVGSNADRPAGDDVLAAIRQARSSINLMGRTDLAALSGVLLRCRALLTNDSGAMHFAAALGVNTATMIGPTRERETAAVGAGRHEILMHAVWCRPCMLRDCPLTHRCMTGIRPDRVLAVTRALL